MNQYATILDAEMNRNQTVLRAIVTGKATPAQRHAYKQMQRDAKRRSAKYVQQARPQ